MLRGKDRPAVGPSYMSEEQKAQYLRDLRAGHASRPSGSRPPPPSKLGSLRRTEAPTVVVAEPHNGRPSLSSRVSMPTMQTHETATATARNPFAGRPLVRPPSATSSTEANGATTAEKGVLRRTPSMTYVENGTRWMEKQETRSIREAMQDMDLEEEKKLHAAAQQEASELVWKHQHPDAPYPNPDAPKDYRSHLRKGSYQRSHSRDSIPIISQRSASDSSQDSKDRVSTDSSISSERRPLASMRKISPPTGAISMAKRRPSSDRSYGGLAEAVADDIAQAHRRSSSGSRRILSGEKRMFMHPDDRIWEDPQEEATPPRKAVIVEEPVKFAEPAPRPQPTHVRKNPFARVRMQADRIERSQSEPIVSMHRVEVQKNAPSQSRNPWYMSNEPLPPTPPRGQDQQSADEVAPKSDGPITPTKDGKEVRGDDLRAATSKRRSDYSPKLPRPTAVSDKPGRPIVSFQQDWRPKQEPRAAPPLPRSDTEPIKPTRGRPSLFDAPLLPRTTSDDTPRAPVPPPIPTLILPDDPPLPPRQIPTINLPDDDDDDNNPPPSQPPPTIILPEASEPRAPSIHTSLASSAHSRPRPSGGGPLCAHCALPIAGRILSAANQRFHPACFTCHHCSTNLELVAFYPAPASSGTPQRFYCHLDYHELFSPRCKSCRTPIEGEVVLACGAEWHPGHFFCALCGDPFAASTPFVERDGHAWCVGCHGRKYAARCGGCGEAVVGEEGEEEVEVVKALGREWHGRCFVCGECSSPFPDGKFFLRPATAGNRNDKTTTATRQKQPDEIPVCVRCEERRLKA